MLCLDRLGHVRLSCASLYESFLVGSDLVLLCLVKLRQVVFLTIFWEMKYGRNKKIR